MRTIEEQWNYEDRKLLFKVVEEKLSEGKNIEIIFEEVESIFKRPKEQCKHVYYKFLTEAHPNNPKKIELKDFNDKEFYDEIIKYYKEGKLISESIKCLGNKYNLNNGSIKARWYKLIKKEEYKNMFESDRLTMEKVFNGYKEKKSSKENHNQELLNININFFNEFYLSIKDKPELLKKLTLYSDLMTEQIKLKEKFEAVTAILIKE